MSSREFKEWDRFVKDKETGKLVRTGFLVWKLYDLLLDSPSEFIIDEAEVKVLGVKQKIFTLSTVDKIGKLLSGLITGDLPCPTHCMPPQNSFVSPANRFDAKHFVALVKYCKEKMFPFIDVALTRSKGSKDVDSMAIYANSICKVYRNPKLGHPVFITE